MASNTQYKFGPEILPGGDVKFRLWAPDAETIELCLENKELPMQKAEDGWFILTTDQATVGSKYMFKLPDGLKVPDPASRCQANDVHGWSVVVDNSVYDWGNNDWKGIPWEETILYELHTGTFTGKGTFKGLKEKLCYFVELGVTAVELMPIADFPGKWNWGYDGVLQFAPDTSYGSPDELKDLIKALHSEGIQVFLDVVYNHFGPDGNYLYCYAKSQFFESKHTTPWGNAINFENRNVRDFYIENVLYWLEEYKIDGLRFDAVHEIKDDSNLNILVEIAQTVKERIKDRHVHLVLENDDNEAWLLNDFIAQWNDDFHHCVHILLTHEDGGYYGDYTDKLTPHDTTYYLARCLAEGYAYQGELSPYRNKEPRGENSKGLNVSSFVNFIQNHDQVGNRAFGERLSVISQKEKIMAAAKLYLLSPTIPLLFMGEEWNSMTPFMFFCNLSPELSDAIREGRRREFSRFPEFAKPENRERIPDPTIESTYQNSKLDWNDIDMEMLNHYKELIKIRKEQIIPMIPYIDHSRTEYEIIGEGHFQIKWTTPQNNCLIITADLNQNSVEHSFVQC